jgi:hypothetical protein
MKQNTTFNKQNEIQRLINGNTAIKKQKNLRNIN